MPFQAMPMMYPLWISEKLLICVTLLLLSWWNHWKMPLMLSELKPKILLIFWEERHLQKVGNLERPWYCPTFLPPSLFSNYIASVSCLWNSLCYCACIRFNLIILSLRFSDAVIILSTIDDMMKEEANYLHQVIDVLHLKHKEYADAIEACNQRQSADQSELKRLEGICNIYFHEHSMRSLKYKPCSVFEININIKFWGIHMWLSELVCNV